MADEHMSRYAPSDGGKSYPKIHMYTREQVVDQILNYRAREIVHAMDNGSENAAQDAATMRVPELLADFLDAHKDDE